MIPSADVVGTWVVLWIGWNLPALLGAYLVMRALQKMEARLVSCEEILNVMVSPGFTYLSNWQKAQDEKAHKVVVESEENNR